MVITRDVFEAQKGLFLGAARTTTFLILEELLRRDYHVEMPFWPTRTIRFTDHQGRTRMISGIMNWNTPALARVFSGNKLMTYEIAKEAGLPIIDTEVYSDKQQAVDFWRRYEGKCILKTVNGQGGTGIYNYFESEEDYALQAQKLDISTILILQRKLSAILDTRLLFIGGQFVAATTSQPLYLTGDGTTTTGALLEAENIDRQRFNASHHPSMAKKIVTPEKLKKRTGLGTDHVLADGERIQATLSNTNDGGIATDATSTIHSDFIESASKLVSILQCPVLAVDFLCDNTQVSFAENESNVLFLETNTQPGIDLNQYPHIGEGRDVAALYIDYVLEYCKN